MWWLLVTVVLTYYVVRWFLHSLKVGDFNHKHVFITGCDSGFGRKLAIKLDGLGFHVFAGCFTHEGRNSLANDCSSHSMTLTLDVTSSESIDSALETITQKLPPNTGLWAVVNNAGISGQNTVIEMCPEKGIRSTLDVMLFGPIEICRKFLPLVRKSRGRIVNMTSVAGRFGGVTCDYVTAKFGLEGFSDVLRREVSGQGVKVSIIEPGYFRTELLDVEAIQRKIKVNFEATSPQVRAVYGQSYVEKRCAIVKDVATKKSSPDVHLVVDAYTDAITSRYPRARYVVGSDAKFFYIPLSYLPEWMSDYIFITVAKQSFKTRAN